MTTFNLQELLKDMKQAPRRTSSGNLVENLKALLEAEAENLAPPPSP